MEKIVNDWVFAKQLDQYSIKELNPLITRVENAKKVMEDPNHKWADAKQKETAQKQYDYMVVRLQFLTKFLEEGVNLVNQHEKLVDLISKVYDKWFENISNEGKQEIELMDAQAVMLNDIFLELYNALLPLNLEGMKAPQSDNPSK